MAFVFDPAKDELNVEKHGLSLSRAADMEIWAILRDDRIEYGEMRFRAFGSLDGNDVCLAFTYRVTT